MEGRMTEEEQQALVRENLDLKDEIRVTNDLLRSALAQVEELRNSPDVRPVDKDHWYGYKGSRRMGAFSMLHVVRWEGSQLREDGPWNYVVHFIGGAHLVFGQPEFDKFAPIFDAYLKRP